jgi:hypothetical protein
VSHDTCFFKSFLKPKTLSLDIVEFFSIFGRKVIARERKREEGKTNSLETKIS